MLSTLVRAAAVLAGLAVFQGSDVQARRAFTKADLRARQEEAVRNLSPQRRAESGSGGPGTVKNITFSNPRASGEQFLGVEGSYTHDKPEFYVDGATIPLVDWDVGPSWAGLLPISNKTDETRQVRDSLER